MPESDFVFERGNGIQIGSAGEHNYVFANNEHVTDTGGSELVYESGTGLGGEFSEIFASAIVQVDPNDPDFENKNTTAINGDNIDNERVELTESLDEGVEDRAVINYEDADDFDYRDCEFRTDQSMLEEEDYVTITIEHLDANLRHEWWLGPSKEDGYYIGPHDSDEEGTIVWEGRYYRNGDVTDPDGNKLGTWN